MGLGRRIVKKLDLKLTLGMADRRKTESPPDEESWGGGQRFKSWSDPKSPSLGVWLFLVQSITVPVEHSLDVKQRPKNVSFLSGLGVFLSYTSAVLDYYTCLIPESWLVR